jgi:hypothetical protein
MIVPPVKTYCTYCFRPIGRQRDGAWYHEHNASVSCKPGWNSTKATPGTWKPAVESSTSEAVPDHDRVKIIPEGLVDRRSPAVRAIDERRRHVEWSSGPAVWGDQ